MVIVRFGFNHTRTLKVTYIIVQHLSMRKFCRKTSNNVTEQKALLPKKNLKLKYFSEL